MAGAASASSDVIQQLLVGIARYGLGVEERCSTDHPLDPGAWARLLQEARRERLLGLLAAILRAGALPVTEQQAAQAEEMLVQAMSHCLRLEQMALEAASALDVAGVPVRVLKGVAVAHLDYPNPAFRPFADVDILVPTGQMQRAATALRSVDLRRMVAPLSARYERQFVKSSTFADPARRQLDVHRTLAIGPVGLAIPPDDLWAGSQELPLGGVRLRALDRPRRVLHAAITVAVADWPARLIAQRDIAELLLFGAPDLGDVLETADRWRARPVLLRAIADTWGTLGLPDEISADLVEAIGVPPSRIVLDAPSTRLLRPYRREHRSFARLALAGIRVVPSEDRMDYVRALLVPDRSHVHNRLRKLWARKPAPTRATRGGRR